MSSKTRYEVWVGALLIGAVALLAWMALRVGALGSIGPQVTVELRVHDAAGITPGASVQVYGVEVGRVDAMSLLPETAVAKIKVGREYELKRNVLPRIRSRSILGEKYIEFAPQAGEAELLHDGDVLLMPVDQIELDELVQTGGTLIDKLDTDAIAEALKILTDGLRDDPEQIKRWFDYIDTIAKNGAEASERIVPLMEHADASLARIDTLVAALEARAQEAQSPIKKADEVLEEFKGFRTRIDGSLDRLDGLLDKTNALLQRGDGAFAFVDDIKGPLTEVLTNFAAIDKWELRRLLREEGILIRLKPDQVLESSCRTGDAVGKGGVHDESKLCPDAP